MAYSWPTTYAEQSVDYSSFVKRLETLQTRSNPMVIHASSPPSESDYNSSWNSVNGSDTPQEDLVPLVWFDTGSNSIENEYFKDGLGYKSLRYAHTEYYPENIVTNYWDEDITYATEVASPSVVLPASFDQENYHLIEITGSMKTDATADYGYSTGILAFRTEGIATDTYFCSTAMSNDTQTIASWVPSVEDRFTMWGLNHEETDYTPTTHLENSAFFMVWIPSIAPAARNDILMGMIGTMDRTHPTNDYYQLGLFGGVVTGITTTFIDDMTWFDYGLTESILKGGMIDYIGYKKTISNVLSP